MNFPVALQGTKSGWQGIRKFKNNSGFYTWIYQTTTNLCIDFVRRRDRRPTTTFEEAIDPDTNVAEPPSSNPSPTDEVLRSELRKQSASLSKTDF